ncbi:hypothetical protein [Vreelandella stevensii]|uniref:hypothetical protein n=1 Tax=Vreelandella stevensii TaxID=502821 RepID=UPI00403B1F57
MSEQAQPPAWMRPPKTPAELLAEAQKTKIAEINAAYTEQAEPLIREYPQVEQATWLAQENEARAYLAWHAAQSGEPPVTPVLTQILAGRNGHDGAETMVELCVAVMNNADMFTTFQTLTGRRQRLVKQVRAAVTPEAVHAIHW